MNKTMTAVATALLVAGTSATLAAQQNDTDIAAYIGIQSTPMGALPPVVTGTRSQMGFHGQFGRVNLGGGYAQNNFGGGVSLPHAGALISVTAAYASSECPATQQCEGHFMMAGNWNRTVMGMAVGTGNERAMLRVGVDAGLGYGRPDLAANLSESAWSAGIGLPVTLMSAGKGVQISPFVVPRFALGRYGVEGSDSETGTSLMLGGGLGISGLTPNLGINVGFQKAFLDGAATQYGIGLTWR